MSRVNPDSHASYKRKNITISATALEEEEEPAKKKQCVNWVFYPL